MKNNYSDWKRIIAIATAIIAFIFITFAYFNPLLQGKKLKQHDIEMHKGASKEIVDYRANQGGEPLWTNSMFSGMPAWQISVVYSNNLIRYVKKVLSLGFPHPADMVFMYMLGFFILMLVLKVNVWMSMLGAIAFGFSTYFMIILGAGHNSKAVAIGYMAPVIAGIVLTYQGKYWWGGLLTAIAVSLEVMANHLQITYYLLIIIVIIGIFQFIDAIRFKTFPKFLKASGVLIIAAIIGIMPNFTSLYATNDYGKESMRGKPVLTKDIENQTRGLDRDYITQWSYGIGETWSLLIPNAKGGATTYIGEKNPALSSANPSFRSAIAQQNAYWGDQPGTSGPVYVGAIILFLFVLGIFVVKGKWKWILLSATILSILLSWGKNWMPFTDFFLDWLPGYNKFRAVSMTLVIAELCIPILAILAIKELYNSPDWLRNKTNRIYFIISFALTGGIALLFYAFPSAFFSFFSQLETQQFNKLLEENASSKGDITMFMNQLEAVRIHIFRADALRSFLFITIAAIGVFFFGIGKLKQNWLTAGLVVLVLFDLIPINQRYLNNNNFISKRKHDSPFTASKADKEILNDSALDYRVLNLTKDVFNDASTSYFHKSIGGYHGAKLQRYQDFINHYLANDINGLKSILQSSQNLFYVNEGLKRLQFLNLLNTKYIIISPDAPPIVNNNCFGNAWIVNDIVWVDNPNAEIDSLAKVDLQKTAVVSKDFAVELSDFKANSDVQATISMTDYQPNHLTYHYSSKEESLVVFSEIWTRKDWNLTVDGQKHPLLRADYLLRAALIPAGEHSIEMTYSPNIWKVGQTISLISSSILILLLIIFVVGSIIKKQTELHN